MAASTWTTAASASRPSTLDGHGLKSLQACGIEPIVITGRDSPAVRRRMADLGLKHAAHGARDKLAVAEPPAGEPGLAWGEVGAMGDDWPDLPLMRRAALPWPRPAPTPEVLAVAHHVTRAAAGHGAARECCDLVLMAAGRYTALLDGHLDTLDGSAPAP